MAWSLFICLEHHKHLDDQVVKAVEQRPLTVEMLVPPSDEELSKALSSLKEGRAAGDNGIMPELVKCGGVDCFEHMLDLFQAVWVEQKVPVE